MKKANPKTKGQSKENIVARHLKKKGWNILYQNKKILGVEIDILAEKKTELALIEVKSIRQQDLLENIIKEKQKERLKKAAESLCASKGLRLFLAAVDDKNKIEFFEIN